MALPQIRLFNLTGSDIDFTQLAVTVPASPGSFIVSDFNFTDEILNDEQLQTELGAGNIRVDITGGGLSSSDTTKTLEQSKAIIKPLHDLDIKHNLSGTVAPIATDDEDSGYSVGSFWVDETNDNAYVCVDATSTAAVWEQINGAASAWSAVLAVGNTSGGTDPVISSGDTLRGVDVSSGAGGALAMRGGDTTEAGLVNGGDVTIDGGDYGGASGFARGGNITLTGGVATAGNGGAVSLIGGTPSSGVGTGGSIFITSGDGGTGFGNASAGNISIVGGNADGASSSGGNITITGGESGDGFNGGGAITITAGLNNATGGGGSGGNGGALTMSGGASVVENGGSVFINGGDMTGAGTAPFDFGGSITLTSGTNTGGGTLYTIGSINLTVPSPVSPSTQNVGAGHINLTAGDNGLRNGPGGSINLTAGDTFGGFPNDGGMVTMTPGTSNLGIDGRAKIDGTGTLEMVERAAKVGNPVTAGFWWVRNDAPNVPMFTDDAGNDWVLNETGASTLQEAYEGGNTIVTSAPEGIFSVTGTETITLQATAANASLSALNVSITSLGAAAAGDVNITGGNSSAATNLGGDIFLNAGDGNTTGDGGTITGTAGDGGADGDGGAVSWMGGAAGATSGTGGAVSITGGAGSAGGGVGGLASVTGGASVGANVGGQATILAGAGGATGAGGKVNVVAGAGGSTSGNGGAVGISSGSPTDGDGGTIGLIAAAGVGTNRSGGTITLDAGNSTGSANGAAISITAGDGSVTSVGGRVNITGGDGRTGGDVVITSGDALTASDASGNVQIIASNGGNSPGQIIMQTESDDTVSAPISMSTQSGFGGQYWNVRTFGTSDEVLNGAINQTVVTLGSILNGENIKVRVEVTARDDATDSNVASYRFEADFLRSGGTVTQIGAAYTDANRISGSADFTSNVSFDVAISGGTVILRVTNDGGSGTQDFDLNIAAVILTQIGGANS